MGKTLVIAECGSSHDNSLDKFKRLIDAAKECGANVAKGQYWSDSQKLANRRGMPENAKKYEQYRMPREWLEQLKAHCDSVGIEWACTSYLIEDIATIAPLVKRFKVSAFEGTWPEFVAAHYPFDKEIILSQNWDKYDQYEHIGGFGLPIKTLLCTSEYPTPLEKVGLRNVSRTQGLSDHTANVLTGAAAVAVGASIVEAHIRLHDTDKGNPDYGHSLVADEYVVDDGHTYTKDASPFWRYVSNIRTVERML